MSPPAGVLGEPCRDAGVEVRLLGRPGSVRGGRSIRGPGPDRSDLLRLAPGDPPRSRPCAAGRRSAFEVAHAPRLARVARGSRREASRRDPSPASSAQAVPFELLRPRSCARPGLLGPRCSRTADRVLLSSAGRNRLELFGGAMRAPSRGRTAGPVVGRGVRVLLGSEHLDIRARGGRHAEVLASCRLVVSTTCSFDSASATTDDRSLYAPW